MLAPRSLIGMIHLPPLPGSPGSEWPLARIVDYACHDAELLVSAGFHALMIENFGDSPFRSTRVDAHTISCMTVAARAIRSAVSIPIGINVLRNDPQAALAIATICEAQYIRVNVHSGVYATDQGIIEGRADETLRYRKSLGSTVAIFADVHVKHAQPLSCPHIAEAAEETAYRGRADGLIVSGTGTGKPTSVDDLRAVKTAVPDRLLLVGSGASLESASGLFAVADALIVGTAIKIGGKTTAPVDPDRAKAFVDAVAKH